MRRRRFLTLAAAFACAPRVSTAGTWRGHALGAEVSVTLRGPRGAVAEALAEVPRLLERVEAAFSIYRPDSEVSTLNRTGALAPSPLFRRLMAEADRAHSWTGGRFDPTVQPLWRALAEGRDPGPARALIGWDRVSQGAMIRLDRGQALTFNGIAQGFATDLVRDRLVARGASEALIDIGEQQAIGGPFRLGLTDPAAGHLGTRTLTDGAIATSSPGALWLGTSGHILSPSDEPARWSTVSVEGPSATQADALSTAAVFMSPASLGRLRHEAGLARITLVTPDGDLRTI